MRKNKRIKLIAGLLALTIFVSGCSSNSVKKEDDTSKTSNDSKNTESTETTDLRKNNSKYLSVNGREYSFAEFYNMYDLYAGILAMRQQLNSELTRMIVQDAIISKELEENKISVSDDDVQKELDVYKKNLGGEEEFKKYLSVLGIDFETFKQNIANSIKVDKHKELYKENNKISEEDINKYYEENKNKIDSVTSKHILVEQEDLAKEIVEKIRNGESFEELNQKYSIDETAKANGGSLGTKTKDSFVEEFSNPVFELEVGKVSDPIKTQFGYHIVEVSEKNVGVEKNKEAIQETLQNKNYDEDLNKKVNEAELKIYDEKGQEVKY